VNSGKEAAAAAADISRAINDDDTHISDVTSSRRRPEMNVGARGNNGRPRRLIQDWPAGRLIYSRYVFLSVVVTIACDEQQQ